MIAAATWAGTIPTWLILGIGLLVAWRVTKGGGGSAVTELSKANEVLTQRVHELGTEVRDLRVQNATLRERTDVSLAIVPAVDRIVESIGDHELRALDALDKHEGRAIERHERQLGVLAQIAHLVGPEPNGHEEASA